MKTLSAPLHRMMAMVMIMMMMVFVLATPVPAPRAHLRRENVNMANPHLPADHNNSTRSAMWFIEIAAWNNTGNNMGTNMGNSTENAMGNTNHTMLLRKPDSVLHPGATGARCVLSTCGTVNLIAKMQGGEEKAGSATTDPHGPGRK